MAFLNMLLLKTSCFPITKIILIITTQVHFKGVKNEVFSEALKNIGNTRVHHNHNGK